MIDTPTPWRIEPGYIVAANGVKVATIEDGDSARELAQQAVLRANAWGEVVAALERVARLHPGDEATAAALKLAKGEP